MKKKLITLILIIAIASCSGPPRATFTYIEPVSIKNNSSITLDKPFDEAWVGVIEYVSSSFFAITSFEKDSGLLTLSFSATPELLVDCGTLLINNKRQKNYLEFLDTRPSSSLTLDGIMNITAVEKSEGKTTITVNARYILNVVRTSYNRVSNTSTRLSDFWTFDSNSSDTVYISANLPGSSSTRTCMPTGAAENSILKGVRDLM